MALELDARLRAFAAVARHGSISRAAEALLLSQPAVSRHVASLERELGVPLLDRGWRGVTLTEAGRVLADHVLRAEALLSQASRHVAALVGELSGSLSLAASGTPANYLLPPLVAAFQDAHPGLAVELAVGTSASVANDVREHRAEIGFVGGLAAGPDLRMEPLVEDEIVLVAAPDRFPATGPVTARQLTDVGWVEREEGSATRAVAEAALADIGVHPRRRLVLPGWEMVKLAVAGGAGVAALSRLAIEVELRAGTLVVLDVPGWHARRHLSVITARDVDLTPAATRFLNTVASVVPPTGRVPATTSPA
ncbi:MAG TPA: LysR family transcriptional regulator [Candidatus Limnocylindria bacterium]|nr:LysR family transcriptional regulator [Candidatus Limnocylindria bacterium]